MNSRAVRTTPFFDRIRSIGYQPFIQIGIQSETATDFVICHTQQELARFADALGALPQRGQSPFLMGLHAAMSLEFYDAGERFFEWCLQGDDGVALEVLDFSKARTRLAFPLEFPIFVLFMSPAAAAAQNPSDRAEGLSRLISMYHATSGNDAMRWTLMEGAALGASKYYGHIGEYAAAMANIRTALNLSLIHI